jgi:hypothetical protein
MPQLQLTALQKKLLIAWLAAFLLVNISDQFGGTNLHAQFGLVRVISARLAPRGKDLADLHLFVDSPKRHSTLL